MILQEKIHRGKIDEDFMKLQIMGNVDDILQLKTPNRLREHFFRLQKNKKVCTN